MGHAAPMATMASYEVLRRGPVSETKFGAARHIAYNMSDDTAASWSDRLTRPPFVDSTNLYSAKIDRTETPHALRSTQPAPNTRPIASTQRGLAAISFRRMALGYAKALGIAIGRVPHAGRGVLYFRERRTW